MIEVSIEVMETAILQLFTPHHHVVTQQKAYSHTLHRFPQGFQSALQQMLKTE